MTKSSAQLTVTTDIKKNRLYFTVTGEVSKKDLDRFYTDVRFLVADLQQGFDLIAIYSDCKLAHLSALPTFRKITNFLITNGLHEVIRIMPEECVFVKQALNLTARMQGYKPIYASSLREAEEKLDSIDKRNGLRFHLYQFPVEYQFDGITQNGHIQNISISGCAVSASDITALSIDKEVKIKIAFDNPDSSQEIFEIVSRVVRVEDDSFAVQFNGFKDEREKLLFEHLAQECQCDVKVELAVIK